VPAADPVEPLFSLLSQAVTTPWRLIESATGPVRADLTRGVRRALGVSERPRPRETDPDLAFMHPASVTRRIHGDLPPMVIGGMAALLLQTLHPLAMAGVAEHSAYEDDPLGRLRRTAAFVGTTTYGTKEEARRAIALVRGVHRKVRGVAPDGRPYSANDPDLLTWVHVAEMASFLAAVQRYGSERFTGEEADAYFAETSLLALELGAQWAPRSRAEVTAYFARMRPELYAGDQAIEARDFLFRGLARRPQDRASHTIVVAAAVSVLPGWARAALRIPNPPLFDQTVVVPVTRLWCGGLRWALSGGNPDPAAPEQASPDA
jgi:uncharacterized protein (DUF2236 family)